jgi:hypothetical protein
LFYLFYSDYQQLWHAYSQKYWPWRAGKVKTYLSITEHFRVILKFTTASYTIMIKWAIQKQVQNYQQRTPNKYWWKVSYPVSFSVCQKSEMKIVHCEQIKKKENNAINTYIFCYAHYTMRLEKNCKE